MKETRTNFLKMFLGGNQAEAVLKAAESAEKHLDEAGVTRKEGNPVMILAQDVASALTTAGVTLPANAVELISAPIQAAVTVPPEAPQTKEIPPAEDADQYKALKALADNQATFIETTTKDFGEIAKAVVDIAQALHPITESVQGLDSRMSAIESQLKERPRAASQAAETVVQNTEIEKKIKEGAEATKTVLGIPLKN